MNDSLALADELGALLSAPGRKVSTVNLIPYNPTGVLQDFSPTTSAAVTAFQRRVR